MAQTIMMAKRYQKRPSEIMNIDNDYLAYMFDETAMYLENKATDDKGNLKWNRIRWSDNKSGTNQDLIKFAQTGK